jgi:hypothetical protein
LVGCGKKNLNKMPKFSKKSKKILSTCHEDLQLLFEIVIKEFDCTIICGYRGRYKQIVAFKRGYSKKQYPNSKHNESPAMAVDVIPYPIDWGDKERMYYFAGYVKRVALELGLKIRWGGDWNSDNVVNDQKFIDLPHFELRG